MYGNATDLCVLGLGFWGLGEHYLYCGFWHFVIGVLSRDPTIDLTIIVIVQSMTSTKYSS